MPENFCLYSALYDALPESEMKKLALDVTPEIAVTNRGLTYTYEWPDLKILCGEMPKDEIAKHLLGFSGYVRTLCKGHCEERAEPLVKQIQRTRLVVGVEFDPGRDAQERAEDLLGKLSFGLKPIIFFSSELYDWNSRLILGSDGSFDPAAEW